MPTTAQIQNALGQIHDQPSFFKILLAETLGWPTGDVQQIDDIAYDWSQQDLNAVGLERHLVEGPIWQIQPTSPSQPWGIFILEFKHEDALSTRRGMAGVLRRVLRGLVTARRKNPKLPSWRREHLLFICTHKWSSFRFAYYRPKPDEPRSAKLTTFGWLHDTPKQNRTVCEFNLPALVWPDDPSDTVRWVTSWAKAFDKEPLTKDFFKRFDKALEAIKSDLEQHMKLPSAEAYTQSQLLLERLIFLYFLQNRGWLNRDRHYLRTPLQEHIANSDKFTYYGDFLDKVFWTLSSAPGEGGRLPGIPFLNGGLFDDDEFRQPADLRKTTPPLKVRNGTMQYVFDELLEAFNFTVTEDTPLNQEVAVDPEMLGKVFESIVLHAEQADPDATAPDKRKATGSYYTPRIVVHFICREVLYQYLINHLPGDGWGPRLKKLLAFDLSDGIDEEEKNELKATITPDQARLVLDLVKPLKCCDPAVGSGAFPVGLMQELVNLRRLLETVLNGYRDPVLGPQGSSWLHDAKAEIVENCLYGVDIQQQAIEICRLRLWLSLVVDYDLGLDPFTAEYRQFSESINHISQLPNLEMNFRRGDSLHDHVSGIPVVILPDRASRHAAEFAAIAKLGADLHQAKRAERKKKLRLDILEKRLELSRKIINEELQTIRQRDSALDRLFADEESDSEKRKRNQREIERLEKAMTTIEADQKDLEKLRRREADSKFYPILRKLEGADFDSPFNFAWSIDFPGVFAGESRGFDLIVGNPPFVTARNPIKRELWRERWPRVCVKKYQLVAPFFECSFGLLRTGGELGFIVSNAFAKREFGKPLVETFFPTVDVAKVVDCSGLSFPGHGTPTCILCGQQTKPLAHTPVSMTAILPGGGDLGTPPEDSPLWAEIARRHDEPGFVSARISVKVLDRADVAKWPWNFDSDSAPTKDAMDRASSTHLRQVLSADVGFMFIIGRNDIFILSVDSIRRLGVSPQILKPMVRGDEIRNYSFRGEDYVIFPYDPNDLKLLRFPSSTAEWKYFEHFKPALLDRPTFSGTFGSEGRVPYQFHQLPVDRARDPKSIAYPEIATHGHFVFDDSGHAFNQKGPLLKLTGHPDTSYQLLTGLLNSSAAMFWLKYSCFNKGAGEDEHRDRFEYAGGKVEQLPLPSDISSALGTGNSAIADLLTVMSTKCWRLGREVQTLSIRKLFQKPGEAYYDQIASFPGQILPHPTIATPFVESADLSDLFELTKRTRAKLLGELVALQEESDWLVYAAYGLLSVNDPAVAVRSDPEPLKREERPYRLWDVGEGNFDKAVSLVPKNWSSDRRNLWEARLAAIRGNEQIRRIEQPVYKRRWDEQWKVANRWRCGEIAYAAEFADAFEWWLKEKAEWWLECKKNAGPVELVEWTQALWKDERVKAAWPVAAEQYVVVNDELGREKAKEEGEPVPVPPKPAIDFSGFTRKFKEIVEKETVPDGFPFGVDYDDLRKKLKKDIPAKIKKVRGQLNVPRERFHSVSRGQYKWAGLQFQNVTKR